MSNEFHAVDKKRNDATKIAFAWELGENFGHIARSLPIAQRVRSKGCNVVFAVRDIEVAHSLLTPQQIPFVAAPRPLENLQLRHTPANYGQILAECGYARRSSLRAMLVAWMNVWRLVQPGAVVVDHSPTALLAARALGIPAMLLGTGFTIPPDADPLPPINPWDKIPLEELRRSDDVVLGNINDALNCVGADPLACIADLFTGLPALIATFPELDHYGSRTMGTFIGPFASATDHPKVSWTRTDGARVFAYLRMSVMGVESILRALKDVDGEVICAIPDIPNSLRTRLDTPSFRIYPHAVDLPSVLKNADVAVSYGGAGLTAEALTAGTPLLLVPQFIEQYLGARCVQRLGAGILIDRQRPGIELGAALTALLTQPSYKEAAAALARKFSAFDATVACESATNAIIDLVRDRAPSPENGTP